MRTLAHRRVGKILMLHHGDIWTFLVKARIMVKRYTLGSSHKHPDDSRSARNPHATC